MATLWLVVGTIAFLAATALFAFLGTRAPEGSRHFHIITATITAIVGFSYFLMATGPGAVLVEDRLFYYFRYVDWVFTTPLLLLDLALLALANPRRNAGLIAAIIGLDVFMILTGLLAGSRVSAVGRGFWFIVSTAAFVVLLYLLVTQLFAAAQRQSGSVGQLFRTLAYLTVVLWTLYPIVWLIGTEGFEAVSSTTEVFLFLVLDVLAKIGFGLLLLTNHQALSDVVGGQAQPSRVR